MQATNQFIVLRLGLTGGLNMFPCDDDVEKDFIRSDTSLDNTYDHLHFYSDGIMGMWTV